MKEDTDFRTVDSRKLITDEVPTGAEVSKQKNSKIRKISSECGEFM